MDFLTKHYEKLLLVFCLVCLLAGMVIVLLSLEKTEGEVRTHREEARRQVTGGAALSSAPEVDTNIDVILDNGAKDFNIMGSAENAPKGSLMQPPRIIICATEGCGNLIPFEADTCPFCKQKEPEVARESPEGADTDADGIPDVVEKQHEFLNFRDPTDAAKDQDGDGFSNLEEYRAGSKMDDPDDFPHLALHVKAVSVWRPSVNIKLEGIETNHQEKDPLRWDIDFSFPDPRNPRNPRWRRTSCRLDDDSNVIARTGFKVIKAEFREPTAVQGGDAQENGAAGNEAAKPAGPVGVVVIQNIKDPSEQYELIQGAPPVKNRSLKARLIFLETRFASDFGRMNRRAKVVTPGETFEFEKEKSTGMYRERYRLLSADETKGTCRVACLDPEDEKKVLAEFDVEKLDKARDLIETGDRGGAPDEPMDEPGPGRRRQPPRR